VKKINYKKYPLPRIRHHANPALYFPLSQHKTTKINYPPLIQQLEWKNIFLNGAPPDYLDVGTGLGRFLIDMGANTPQKNILGFEIRESAVRWTNSVLDGEKITNAKALWYSAVNGFPFIKNKSIEKIFYFFPDPWVKKRHHKRRAFSVELLNEFHRILKANGIIYMMTDVPEVDEFHQKILTQHNGFSFSYANEKEWGLTAKTYQEEFSMERNIPFIRMLCVKK
jgi:tRNA (guanine-N7-)-methyltransferase